MLLGLTMFEREECDWSGEPGPAPTTDELCQSHLGRNAQLKMKCKQQQQQVNKLKTFYFVLLDSAY